MTARAAALALVLAGASARIASAEAPLDAARQLYLEADFRGAADAFEAILEAEELEVDVAAAAHASLAALRLMLGDEERARQHAEAAAALDPGVAPPAGAPEGAAELLREAARRGRAELSIEAEEPLRRGVAGEVTARLDPAPRLLAAELTLACRGAEGAAEERGPPPEVTLELVAQGGEARCEAAALGPGGARLLSAERTLEVAGPEPEGEPGPEPALEVRGGSEPGSGARGGAAADPDPGGRGSPWGGWIWVGVGAGAAVVVAAVVLALVFTVGPGGRVILTETQIEGW